MLRLLHKLGIITLIVLIDFNGETYITIKRKNRDGKKWAHVYPYVQVEHVYLNDDGTVSKSYVHEWKPYEPKPLSVIVDELKNKVATIPKAIKEWKESFDK